MIDLREIGQVAKSEYAKLEKSKLELLEYKHAAKEIFKYCRKRIITLKWTTFSSETCWLSCWTTKEISGLVVVK